MVCIYIREFNNIESFQEGTDENSLSLTISYALYAGDVLTFYQIESISNSILKSK